MSNSDQAYINALQDRISFLEAALLAATNKAEQATKDVPQMAKALAKGSHFIHEMKSALNAADQSYRYAVDIFDGLNKVDSMPASVSNMAYLYRQGKSISQMAELILSDKKKKSQMHRLLKKAMNDFPDLFRIDLTQA